LESSIQIIIIISCALCESCTLPLTCPIIRVRIVVVFQLEHSRSRQLNISNHNFLSLVTNLEGPTFLLTWETLWWFQGPLQSLVMCPRWLCVVLIIWLVDTVYLAVPLAYRLQFISLQSIILVPLLSISLLRLAPSTVYYIYGWFSLRVLI